jgi:hypothetical protein
MWWTTSAVIGGAAVGGGILAGGFGLIKTTTIVKTLMVGEATVDLGNVGIAAWDVATNPLSPQSWAGFGLAAIDLASGPLLVGDINTSRIVSQRGKSRSVNTQVTTPRTSESVFESAVRMVSRLNLHVSRQNQRLANAIRSRNRQFLSKLGLSQKQIAVLVDPRHRRFAMEYGNAMERAVSRAIRSDPKLRGMVLDARNAAGTVFPKRPGERGLRPDFGISGGELQGNICDLTTPGQAAAKQKKYHDRVIVLPYRRPDF